MKRITRFIIKHTKYIGWCGAAYQFYREELGKSKYKAWKGAFLLRSEDLK